MGAEIDKGNIAGTPDRLLAAAKKGCVAGEQITDEHPEALLEGKKALVRTKEIITEEVKKIMQNVDGEKTKSLALDFLNKASSMLRQGGSTIPYCTTPEQTNCVKR